VPSGEQHLGRGVLRAREGGGEKLGKKKKEKDDTYRRLCESTEGGPKVSHGLEKNAGSMKVLRKVGSYKYGRGM